MFLRSFVFGIFLSVLFAVPLFADDSVAENAVEQPAEVGATPDSGADPLQKVWCA